MRTTVSWGSIRRALGFGLFLGLMVGCDQNGPEEFQVADVGDNVPEDEDAKVKDAGEAEPVAAAAPAKPVAVVPAKGVDPVVPAKVAQVEPVKVATSEPKPAPAKAAPKSTAGQGSRGSGGGSTAGSRTSGGSGSGSRTPVKAEPIKVEPVKVEPTKVTVEPVAKKAVVPADPNCMPGTLEAAAATGALTEPDRGCLEASFGKVSESLDRERISLVLIQDSALKGDTAGWAKLVQRHLEKVDENNASLAYKYGLHLWDSEKDATATYRWSEVALANRAAWLGSGYDDNVYRIYKLRAAAAQAIWRASEEALAAAEADEEALTRATRARAVTFHCAKEWLEFARATKKDTGTPLQLCTMSGDAGACGAAS